MRGQYRLRHDKGSNDDEPTNTRGAPHGGATHRGGSRSPCRSPRSGHAAWEPSADRPDPVALLEGQAEARVPELVPIRYGRMLVSPFTYFRGAAYPMASDLSQGPNSGLEVQLCGDAHLSNFGFFAAPDRKIVFSVNDFDETLPGPFEWDVKRLVASFAVAEHQRGSSDKQRRRVTAQVMKSYRSAMATFAGMRNIDIWYSRITVDDIVEQFVSVVGKRAVRSSTRAWPRHARRTASRRSTN